jgi:hypothetical protein
MVVLFDDENRVLAHPQISELMARNGGTATEVLLPKLADVDRIGIARAIDAWKKTGSSQQIFEDAGGRVHAAAFRTIASAGPANLRLAVSAPVDEFYSQIEGERRRLFPTALGFVLAVLPIVLWMGTMMSKRMRALAVETDSIRHFDLLETPRIRSVVREIDDLGRSIAAMKSLVRTFSTFIPKRLVRELVESEVPIELGGERRELTILFTDVENFTSLTEAAEPTSVMRMTSRYFSALSEEIMARQGTVDKFIGDAVMAFWNAPNEDERHVSNACRAVLACVEANRRLNVDFAAEGLPPFRTRFGLHVGDVVVGNIGSRDRKPGRILGHEGIGIVDEVGVAVTDFKPGDRVLISCISSCGKCDYCRRGIYSHCRTGGWILGNQINGTQAEYVRTPHADTSLYHLPPGIDEEALVMLSDILPTGFECGVLNGKVAPGSTVAIVGAGPVGLAALLTAQFYTPAGKRHPANDRNGFDPISGCHDAGALDRPA